MNDHSIDIIFYEKSRQQVRDLKIKYQALHGACLGITEELEEYASDFTLNYGNCLNAAYDAIKPIRDENGEQYHYDEIIGNFGCDKCREAWILRCGELSEAKQRFGEAKRNMARVGKSLINKTKPINSKKV